jgi:hypothetical protein
MRVYLRSYNRPEPEDYERMSDPPEDETPEEATCRAEREREADERYLARLDAIWKGAD